MVALVTVVVFVMLVVFVTLVVEMKVVAAFVYSMSYGLPGFFALFGPR